MNIWNDEIAIAFKNNKKALYEWKLNGKPQYGPFKDQKTSTKAKLLVNPGFSFMVSLISRLATSCVING
jgi:hypothetical protein